MYKTEFVIDNGPFDSDIERVLNMPYKVKVGDTFVLDIYEYRTISEGCEGIGGYYPIKIQVEEVFERRGRFFIDTESKKEIYEDEHVVMAFCSRL